MTLTADDLLTQVKITGVIPENQALMTASRILSFANEEIQNELIPLIDSTNQNFFVVKATEATVSGQAEYTIPYRAIGRKLRDLKITDGSATRSMALIALEDAHYYNFSAQPSAFYFQGDKIVLLPTPSTPSLTLEKFYALRPSQLIQTADAGRITNISGTTLTLASVPSAFTAGYYVDTVQGKSGYQTLSMDVMISSVSGNQVVLPSVPTALAVGDYVCQAEKSPVIQLPDEAFSYLVMRTAKRVLEAIGDSDGAATLKGNLPEARKNLLMLLEPRVEGEATKIIQRNGLLRGYRQIRYFRGIFG